MTEKPSIKIFKRKLDWLVDSFHDRQTDPVYIAKSSTDSKQYATDDISTMPRRLLHFYKPYTKIRLLESKERVTINTPNDTHLEVVNESLSHDDISDLVTAFVDESFPYPHYSLDNQKATEIEIFNAIAVYHFSHNQTKKTKPCFVVTESEKGFYRCAYDDIEKLARDITFYFAPGTKIKIPHFVCASASLDASESIRLGIVHAPLTHDQISDLLTGLASRLNYLKSEYEKNCKLGCARRV